VATHAPKDFAVPCAFASSETNSRLHNASNQRGKAANRG
jgi:hypothetical protein